MDDELEICSNQAQDETLYLPSTPVVEELRLYQLPDGKFGILVDEYLEVELLEGHRAFFVPKFDSRYDVEAWKKPSPISDLVIDHCRICQLSWLVGEKGYEKGGTRNHISHQ